MDKYRYVYENGGFVGFEGTQSNLKKISSISAEITNDSHITVTTAYADGNAKKLECDFAYTNDDNAVSLTNLKKYWNKKLMMGADE